MTTGALIAGASKNQDDYEALMREWAREARRLEYAALAAKESTEKNNVE